MASTDKHHEGQSQLVKEGLQRLKLHATTHDKHDQPIVGACKDAQSDCRQLSPSNAEICCNKAFDPEIQAKPSSP